MASGTLYSACVNHPAIEATARCKKCLKPICNACKVVGPVGVFCSPACKEQYEAYVERAAKLDQMKKPKTFNAARIWSLIVKAALLVAVVLVAGFVAQVFGFEIPVLTGVVEWIEETARGLVRG